MRTDEFLALDPKSIDVKSFDCGKNAINTYLCRHAAKNRDPAGFALCTSNSK